MPLPRASEIDIAALDAGNDSIEASRVALKNLADSYKRLLDAIDVANGLAIKDEHNKIPLEDLFEVAAPLEFHGVGAARTLRHSGNLSRTFYGAIDNSRFITRIHVDPRGHLLSAEDAPVTQIGPALYTAWSGPVTAGDLNWATAGYNAILAISSSGIFGGLESRDDAGGGGNKNLRARYHQYVTS